MCEYSCFTLTDPIWWEAFAEGLQKVSKTYLKIQVKARVTMHHIKGLIHSYVTCQFLVWWLSEQNMKLNERRRQKLMRLNKIRRQKSVRQASWLQAKHARLTYSRLKKYNHWVWQSRVFSGGELNFCIYSTSLWGQQSVVPHWRLTICSTSLWDW